MKWILAFALMACAHARTGDGPAFRECAAHCPDGSAFIFENAHDVACFCRKAPDGT